VAAAGDARDPRARPARRARRHDPAVPDVLGDLCRCAEGAPRGDRGRENIRPHVLGKAFEAANKKLTETGQVPLPEGLTPHKLRHTHASILVALGVDPGSVMDQLGHADPGFTLRVYRHGMRRDPAAKERLRALVGGADWATIANSDAQPPWNELAGAGKPSLGSTR
jgi:integrase